MTDSNPMSGAFEPREKQLPSLLLVEDDDCDVLAVKRCHARHGSQVPICVARDGQEALSLLRDEDAAGRPCVILTDLNMPGMSGHEFIAELRSDRSLQNSTIFVISSSRLSGDINRAYQYNIAGYLAKQVPPEELDKGIEMILDYCETVYLPS